ncbi:MAG: Uma2 family endonuclease [Methyloglobulus sp.]|nr:Uma2 family endonuclease [Methyloglobulus sp.]
MNSVITPVRKHLTDIHEWQKIGEANIFPPDSRIELIEGEIIEMAPIGSHHSSHLKRINKLFSLLVKDAAIIAVQDPLQLNDLSEPEPDFMLLRPVPDFYYEKQPNANDVLLLIEVADSSLAYDQNQKLRLYALHDVTEYWLLNLNDNCLEVYRKPKGEVFAEKTTLYSGDSITLSQLPGISIQVADIL